MIRGGRPSVWAVLLLCVTHAFGGGAEATGAAAVSPLIVFAPEFAARANPSTSTEGNATLEAIRSDPAAFHVRTGRSATAAISAALDARMLSVVVPASADGPEAVLTFTGVDVEHDAENLVSLYARDEATDSEVALVIQGADVLGSIRRGDETWKVHPLGDGATAVYTDFGEMGFSVIGQNCETVTFYTFAHEFGHNQGADHNPWNTFPSPPPTFPYRHGRCNVAEGWNTIMSYGWGEQGLCNREIEYFSSPNIRYRGTPTGDAAVRDNRRVLLETARRVANFRQSTDVPPPPPTTSQTLPLVTAASSRSRPGFVRIINHADRAKVSGRSSGSFRLLDFGSSWRGRGLPDRPDPFG